MRWTLVSLCLALGLVSQNSLVDASDCTFDATAVSTPLSVDAYIAVDEAIEDQSKTQAEIQAALATFHITSVGPTPLGNLNQVLGWCVDYTRDISSGGHFMDLYSSYGAQQSGAVDREANLPILTYIINNFKVGDTVAQCGGEPIEFPDIQVAVWEVIDDVALGNVAPVVENQVDGLQYPHDQCIVDYIVDESTPHTTYEPDCNDPEALIAVVMVANGMGTTGTIEKQVIIAEVPVAGTAFCDCPNAPPTPTGSVIGDPHLKTWTGDHYDFHGICDLVLLQNPDFFSGKGMDIHIRTSKIKQWSYISAAVLRIGDETLEVSTDNNQFQYYLNKVEGAGLSAGISGFKVSLNKVNTVQSEIVVDMGEAGSIKFTTFKEMIRVDVKSGVKNVFGSSLGLMGQYGSGKWLARDSATVMEDATEFGMEWQVRPEEPMLFHKVAGPQAPQKCELPTSTSLRRRLLGNTVTLEEAEVACGRVDEDDRDMCIFDVLAMDDKDVAGAY